MLAKLRPSFAMCSSSFLPQASTQHIAGTDYDSILIHFATRHYPPYLTSTLKILRYSNMEWEATRWFIAPHEAALGLRSTSEGFKEGVALMLATAKQQQQQQQQLQLLLLRVPFLLLHVILLGSVAQAVPVFVTAVPGIMPGVASLIALQAV